MDRRKFLVGVGGAAVGGSALVGSGAFTKVESQRQVSIEVATDPNAYLGLAPTDSLNSQNYVSLDDNGHLQIDVGEIPSEENEIGGDGVNSDSYTYFDNMFTMCNQGKADAMISYELPDPPSSRGDINDDWTAPDPDHDDQVVAFYWVDDNGDRHVVEEGQEVPLPLGECEAIGLRTATFGVDATNGDPLIDGDVVLTAEAPGASQPQGTSTSET